MIKIRKTEMGDSEVKSKSNHRCGASCGHARIKVLFYQVGLEETDVITVLHQDGYAINRRTLRRIRKGLGLVRRA